MPTYEYRCTDCGNRVEVFQRIGDDPLTVCEVCGGILRKVFHPAGIVFKGSGFYATDSRKAKAAGDGKRSSDKGGGEKPASEKGGSEAGGGGKGSSGSSEAARSEAGGKSS